MSVSTATPVVARGDVPTATGAGTRRAVLPVLSALVGLTMVSGAGGRVVLLDVVCLAALPLLVATMVSHRRLGVLILVTATWAAGQVVADVANGSAPRASQGLLTAVTVMAITTALVRLSGSDPVRVRLLVAAVMIGLGLGPILSGDVGMAATSIWKYALGAPLSIAVLALCDIRWQAGARRPVYVALSTLAVVNVLLDFRSLAVMTVFTLALYAGANRRGRKLAGVPVLLTGLACFALLVVGFQAAARAGLLGERSAEQFGRDSATVFAVMGDARPELLQAVYLTAQRPLTGYGSQPQVDNRTFSDSLDFIAAHGATPDVNLRRDWAGNVNPGVAQHSMMADAVVMTGVLAVPFWGLVVALTIRRAVSAVRLRASPLTTFWSLLMAWDILFSPLTPLYHVQLAAFLALVLMPVPAPRRAPR
ncbi:MAG TPA: hypothetical protein VF755_00580 [Catenuloplanes sp.]